MQIHGFHPVREALRHRPGDVERVLIGSGAKAARAEEIVALCREHGVATETRSDRELDELTSEAVHNGLYLVGAQCGISRRGGS